MSSLKTFRAFLVSLLAVALLAAGLVFAGSGAAGAATAAPSSSSACQAPPDYRVAASASKVAAGQPVTLTVTYYQCGGGPAHDFTVTARPSGQYSPITTAGHVTTPAGETESGSLTVTPDRSTTYMVTEDGQTYSQPPSLDVTVDRTAGTCSGVIALQAPATATVGSTVALTGTTSDTSTVTILFRRRGQLAFMNRRALSPLPDGTFATSYQPDDDYRLYASTDRCDSPPVLIQALPIVNGPAATRRNSTVTVRVRAAAGVVVNLYFHRAGTVGYALQRQGSTTAYGTYTTTYRATADYRYYAVTGPGSRRSDTVLTQIR
jgi:hypothetical protein